ncbi:FtsX-like permease family protein [Cohnella pontilimi]|uniref:FtsX-like permease family protein n=1 Tax=Cohnella pontilimi TaxID=2564100 RepID=A0A4U0FCP7_9BACL|nr:FtsX-like permease family protein [Cohnella pontilimi]TJY42663.1 FtsX-like permease family protein [Cohnella pontilimi]
MMRLLWSLWWRNKHRFIIILVGVFIVSFGLSSLFNLTESNKGTIVNTFENRWQVPYDILVRPSNTKPTDPKNSLFEPNFQSGITGGISLQQLEEIKSIPEITVAAPISIIGYSRLGVTFPERPKIKETGIYRSTATTTINVGTGQQNVELWKLYFSIGNMSDSSELMKYGIRLFNGDLATFSSSDYSLLAGIDPEQESKLVGLDSTLISVPNWNSRYFQSSDRSYIQNEENSNDVKINLPILLSNQIFVDKKYTFRYEKLDLPYNNVLQTKKTLEQLKNENGSNYLDRLRVVSSQTYVFTANQAKKILEENPSTLKNNGLYLLQHATSLQFNPIKGPYSDRWPYSYELKTFPLNNPILQELFPESYRPYKKITQNALILLPTYVGIYDPTKLDINKEMLAQFPIDAYKIPYTKQVLNDAGNPINPQPVIKPNNNPLGLLTSPPTMLTTLEAAAKILGDKPISVIRIKVADVHNISDTNKHKLEKIASQIRERTGLATDITLGSAPQPVLIHVPKSGARQDSAWVEQQWIKLGSSFQLMQEVKVGFSVLIWLVMLVAFIYVIATNVISLLVRKSQYALLLSLGWRHSHIARLMILEAMILGIITASVSWATQGFFLLVGKSQPSITRFITMGIFGVVFYLIGNLVTVFLLRRIQPSEALRAGEIINNNSRLIKVNSIFKLAFAQFKAKLKRNILSIISITMPTSLLFFFLFVTYRLKGVFYTTWLGEYTAAEIGTSHYLAITICLLISILITAEIIWQNVNERKPEISLLKTLGWPNYAIRKLVLLEGFITGCVAGFLALLLGITIIQFVYHKFPTGDLWFLILLGAVPLFTAVLGSLPPAKMAIRTHPIQGINGNYLTDSKTEIRLKQIVIIFITILMIISAISTIQIFATQQSSNLSRQKPPVQPETLPTKIGTPAGFVPRGVPTGNKSVYDLQLSLAENGKFSIDGTITVENNSSEVWEKIVFYMIPNIFTDNNNTKTYRDSASLLMHEVKLNGENVQYSLTGDTLTLHLAQKLSPAGKVVVKVSYDFVVPDNGIRFTKQDGSYMLAQWYPMLATYNHGWNKEDYTPLSESYHTGFSDFDLTYKLPKEYRIISSSDIDDESKSSGKIVVKNVKELFVAVTKDLVYNFKNLDEIEIRVWGRDADKETVDQVLNASTKALDFFNQNIGPYPHKQLDVILGNFVSMEYPGVVTVGLSADAKTLEHALVHELAHQWFYGVISNDPYHDGWLDESMAEFATSLYLHDYSFAQKFDKPNAKPSNLPLSQYEETDIIPSLYAKPIMNFKSLIEKQGGEYTGIKFLHDYWSNYKYKQINTEEFLRFIMAYFVMEDNSFFKDWIIAVDHQTKD